MLSSFPILTRAYRTQWRTPQFFVGLFILCVACASLFVWTYADNAASKGSVDVKFRDTGGVLWQLLFWLQVAMALLVAPALGAGTIARERERGLFEGLMLAPLSPRRIIVEKWLSALLPLLLIFLALVPFGVVATVMRPQNTASLPAVWGFQILLASAGIAIGVACSAWARRAHLALRSAYGLVTLWLLGSGISGLLTGNNLFGRAMIPGYKTPFYLEWLALSNPILGANDLVSDATAGAHWPRACVTLLCILMFCYWSATRALRRPLTQAQFIGDGKKAASVRKKRAQKVDNADHFEVPLMGSARFDNPVLGREVRSKFRLRQPPPAVIYAEILLALLVAFFYVRTVWTAFTDPSVRNIIFWGVVITGFIVTLMGAAIMGANGFSREHEGGTWESLRLSLLRPREIIQGKAVGIALTCLLFSLPVWPLLLPCVQWRAFWRGPNSVGEITISQLVAVVLIWLGTIVVATMWGLWWGRRTRKTSAASGAVLGTGALWLLGLPLLVLLWDGANIEFVLMWINPFVALAQTEAGAPWASPVTALGLPFLTFALIFSGAVAAALLRAMKREFG